MKILNVKNLDFETKKKSILKNLNFSLNKGEVLSILGPSGSGKSTILKLLAGFLKPTAGEIIMLNKLISSNKLLIPTGKRSIGLMFQEEVLFPHLTVYKNIAFGINDIKLKKKDFIIKKYLKNFGLLNLQNYYPASLSGGEKQRVSLARVLITKPDILLMDEPFSSLDKNLRTDICDNTIKILKKKKISVVFVTHDVSEAFRISDRILVLKRGIIEQIDNPENIYNFPTTKYTATLVSDINQFEGLSDKSGLIRTPFGNIKCTKSSSNLESTFSVKKHSCVIRTSDLFFSKNGISAKVLEKHFLGSCWEYKLFINKDFPILKMFTKNNLRDDKQDIKISIDLNKILIFDA